MTYVLPEYNDDYPTCASTYATLRIYPGAISPDAVSDRLAVTPSETQLAECRPVGVADRPAAWFLSSKGNVESRDVRRHIDWILDQLHGKSDVFAEFRGDGIDSDISCYWLAASHSGGPSLWPHQMEALASLGLEIWFDFYAA